MDPGDADAQPPRLLTGVAGLDVVLSGGLIRASMVVISGLPGTGKTSLASEIAYRLAARGETAIYVSILSESQTRLITSLRSLSFFDMKLVGTRVRYLSGASMLEHDSDLVELAHLLTREVRAHSASLLVIDSTATMAEVARSGVAYRKFLRELATSAALADCTVLMLVPHSDRPEAEEYVADCVIGLHHHERGLRRTHELSVLKFRGSASLSGRHSFEIDSRGVTVHPRRESLPLSQPVQRGGKPGKTSFGVAGLDEMLEGGLPAASVTGLLGAPGSGKTLLGLRFLAERLMQGQPAVYFGLYETPDKLIAKADGVGFSLTSYVQSGALRVLWASPTERLLDEMAERVLAEIADAKSAHVFIDGPDGMVQAAAHPERFPIFFSALANELRARGVTTLVSMETDASGAAAPAMHQLALTATVDNIVWVRYVELRSQLHRLISILKVRDSGYDASIRSLQIGASGLEVARTFESAERVLGERAQQPKSGGTP